MNKYVNYFLIFVCTFMLIILCIHLGIMIEKDINNDKRCDFYESQIKID